MMRMTLKTAAELIAEKRHEFSDHWVERTAKSILKEHAGAQLRFLSDSARDAIWDKAILDAVMALDENTKITLPEIQRRVMAVRQRLGMF